MLNFVYSTGGREKYFKQTSVRDCVCRAVVNATDIDYLEVYKGINEEASNERKSCRKRKKSSARNGVYTGTIKRYIERVLGWVWVPCMSIGTGCQVHLKPEELPSSGSYILNLSGHLSCWRDGKLYDTYDCSRGGTRCVYGYWRMPNAQEKEQFAQAKQQQDEYKEFIAKEKEELSKKRLDVKKHNSSIIKKYAKRINKLKAQLRKLERERDSQLLDMPKLEKNSWAKHCISKEWDENGEYDREGL